MQLIKRTLLTAILLGLAQPALADCTRTTERPLTVNINYGNTIVDADLPAGEVIGETIRKTFSAESYYENCSDDGQRLTGMFTPGGAVDGVYGTYPTGIDGVGLRVSLMKGNVEEFKLGEGSMKGTINPTGPDKSILLNQYTIQVQLIKIKPEMASGELNRLTGLTGDFYLAGMEDKRPVANVRLTGSGRAVVINPSCQLDSDNGRDLIVNLAPTNIEKFDGVGSTSTETKVNFRLRCKGGSDKYRANVNVFFSSGSEAPIDESLGVLANGADERMAAKGIGIQVLSNNAPIELNADYTVDTMGGGKPVLSFPMTARYYQYGNQISGGKIVSHMVYNIYYD